MSQVPPPVQERMEAIGEQLRGKISSKFQTSTFLAGFAATILSIQLSMLWQGGDRSLLLPLSIAIMGGAMALFLAAIVRLDALTMPKRFWPEDQKSDPEPVQMAFLTREDLWGLHDRMIFYWYRFTLVATALGAASLVCLMLPLVGRASTLQQLRWASLGIAVAGVATFLYWRAMDKIVEERCRPLVRLRD